MFSNGYPGWKTRLATKADRLFTLIDSSVPEIYILCTFPDPPIGVFFAVFSVEGVPPGRVEMAVAKSNFLERGTGQELRLSRIYDQIERDALCNVSIYHPPLISNLHLNS